MSISLTCFVKGQTRDLSEPFIARRTLIHKSVAKDVDRIMNKFKMVLFSYLYSQFLIFLFTLRHPSILALHLYKTHGILFGKKMNLNL
jgi:hypothetical protein